MQTQIKGVVFDLDGTLVDSLPLTFDAFNHAIVKLGGKARTPDEIMAHFGQGELQILAKMLGPELGQKAFEMANQHLQDRLTEVTIFEGVMPMLDALKARQMPLAIVTGRGWIGAEIILKHHGLAPRFKTVLAHEHTPESKPAPGGILMACERLGLKPSEILYIGDSPMDTVAARRAGARGIAALWYKGTSRAQFEKSEESKPHRYIETPSEVLGLL